jgi:hypothetical protein
MSPRRVVVGDSLTLNAASWFAAVDLQSVALGDVVA